MSGVGVCFDCSECGVSRWSDERAEGDRCVVCAQPRHEIVERAAALLLQSRAALAAADTAFGRDSNLNFAHGEASRRAMAAWDAVEAARGRGSAYTLIVAAMGRQERAAPPAPPHPGAARAGERES